LIDLSNPQFEYTYSNKISVFQTVSNAYIKKDDKLSSFLIYGCISYQQ